MGRLDNREAASKAATNSHAGLLAAGRCGESDYQPECCSGLCPDFKKGDLMADLYVCSHGQTTPCDQCGAAAQIAGMLILRKKLDPDAPDAIVFREQYTGNFEQSHAAKYPQSVLADLLDGGEINVEQFERLSRERRK